MDKVSTVQSPKQTKTHRRLLEAVICTGSLQESSYVFKRCISSYGITISRAAVQQHTSICGGALPLGSTLEGNSIPAVKKSILLSSELQPER